MAFKTFTSGAVLTAAEVNTYLMQQAVIVCTAATRPSAPVEGMRIVETDTDLELVYDGAAWVTMGKYGAWVAYTPTFSGTIGNGTLTGAWVRHGRLIHFRAGVTWGTTTSHAAATQTLTLPVTAQAAGAGTGGGIVIINQGGTGRHFNASFDSTTTVTGVSETDARITNLLPVTTWASTHTWYVNGYYESAA